MKKETVTNIILISIYMFLFFSGIIYDNYKVDIWDRPAYKCEEWRIKTYIWDETLCKKWDIYKKRIKYYKNK